MGFHLHYVTLQSLISYMKNKKEYIKKPDNDESLPGISLVIPFDPKMRSQPGLFNMLTAAADKTEKELM